MSHHKATWATASVVGRRSTILPASVRGILLHSARSCPGIREFVPAPTGESWRACHPHGTIPHARRPRRAGRIYTRPCQSTLNARSSHAPRVCNSNSGPKILTMWPAKVVGNPESRGKMFYIPSFLAVLKLVVTSVRDDAFPCSSTRPSMHIHS